jgi:diguanylate cyclase (GGDEF)-like protein/PAS domain S-box-containing protein
VIAGVLLPGVMAAMIALMPEVARPAGGRRATLNTLLMTCGTAVFGAAGLAPLVGASAGFSGLAAGAWIAGMCLVTTAAVRRVEAPAAPDPWTNPRSLGAGGLSAVTSLAVLVVLDLTPGAADPGWRYVLTGGALACMCARFLIDRSSMRLLLGSVRQAEERYRTLVEQLPLTTYITGLDARNLRYISPQAEAMLGYTTQEWMDDPEMLQKLLDPRDRERINQRIRERTGQTDGAWSEEYRLIARDGRVVWVENRALVLQPHDEGPPFAQGYLLDITERKQAEEAIRQSREELVESERRFREILENVKLLAVTSDPHGRITFANDYLCDLTGWSQDELLGRLWYGTFTDDHAAFEERLEQMRTGTVPAHLERELITRSGERRIVAWNDTMIRDRDGRVIEVTRIGEDITARRQAEERVAYLNHHDELTGLPNRTLFAEQVDLAIERAEEFGHTVAVLHLDVDDFKLVNDAYGQASGDELMRQLACRIKGAAAEHEIIARLQGDEFAALVAPPCDRAGDLPEEATLRAGALAERVTEALAAPFVLEGDEVYLTVDVGLAVYPVDATSRDDLLASAHIAGLSEHRRSWTRPTPNRLAARGELSAISRLHRAIEREEFVLHYQPVWEMASREMVGVEALIRWQTADGLVPPVEFVPLAERTGLIGPMTDWVVEQACRQLVEWRGRGVTLDIGVNFPAVLWEATAIKGILATIERHGLSPRDLLLEVTESTAMADTDDGEAVMQVITESKLPLAVDDFGTGHSSLARLKQLPLHVLKIDRSFIRDLPDDPDSAAMAVTIIELARNLGLKPLAEGIETEEQAAFLVSRGCVLGQGYLHSRPMLADQVEAMWRQDRRKAA